MNGALSEVAMQVARRFKVPRVFRSSRDKCVAAQIEQTSVEVWHNCLNCSYSRSRSRTICQRNASVKRLRKRSKFQMKNASLVSPRARSLRKSKQGHRPTRRCVQFLGSLDGHKLSPHTHHVSKPTRSQSFIARSLAHSFTFLPSPFPSLPFPSLPFPSLPFPSLPFPSPLLSLFVTALLTVAASFFSSQPFSVIR